MIRIFVLATERNKCNLDTAEKITKRLRNKNSSKRDLIFLLSN